ncbi:MAG TPA: oxidoreductase, partial [Bacteroidia bacterium]|nr:oxidoreductase [Bacteroidia bacterium]
LIGDPAVQLNYPQNNIVTTEVNNVPVTASSSDTLRALSYVTIKGYIADTAGNQMSGFNGILYPTVFDKAKSITTIGNDPPNPPFTFLLQKSVLYHGKVSVVNGDFQFSFIVPRDIAYQYGIGRISYYAEDGQTDAAGFYENVIIGGSNTSAPADLAGPEVELYLNDSNFVSGSMTDGSPQIYAIIRDSNGVNTVGNGIGHDIVALLDEESDNAIVLNDYYQADLNSYKSGKILYPLSDLAPGKHTLSLKVWDVYNNSTTVKTEFVVAESEGLELDHVLNYPNPFTTRTSFFIGYNRCCTSYDVMIQVFTVSGKLVKTINQRVAAEGYRSEAIEWDGRDDYGDKIGRGVYIYRVLARTEEGLTAEKYEKLVILN